jgi:hypothetical protein
VIDLWLRAPCSALGGGPTQTSEDRTGQTDYYRPGQETLPTLAPADAVYAFGTCRVGGLASAASAWKYRVSGSQDAPASIERRYQDEKNAQTKNWNRGIEAELVSLARRWATWGILECRLSMCPHTIRGPSPLVHIGKRRGGIIGCTLRGQSRLGCGMTILWDSKTGRRTSHIHTSFDLQ